MAYTKASLAGSPGWDATFCYRCNTRLHAQLSGAALLSKLAPFQRLTQRRHWQRSPHWQGGGAERSRGTPGEAASRANGGRRMSEPRNSRATSETAAGRQEYGRAARRSSGLRCPHAPAPAVSRTRLFDSAPAALPHRRAAQNDLLLRAFQNEAVIVLPAQKNVARFFQSSR